MQISGTSLHHWNYFLALEKDLEGLSRNIEFSADNLKTYSIELAHMLLSTCSEIDVVMKQLCDMLEPGGKPANIMDYKEVVCHNLENLVSEEISIDRYGITFRPWSLWSGTGNPLWWKSYNNIKHQRDRYFSEANLENTINALGALLITVAYYYKEVLNRERGEKIHFKVAMRILQPEASFLKINADYYYHRLIV